VHPQHVRTRRHAAPLSGFLPSQLPFPATHSLAHASHSGYPPAVAPADDDAAGTHGTGIDGTGSSTDGTGNNGTGIDGTCTDVT